MPFDTKFFFRQLKNMENSTQVETALLPYISWLKNNTKNAQNIPFNEYTKLALNFILRYNLEI